MAPAAAQQQQQSAPQSADSQPGFVVSTPDDEPRQAQAAAVQQQQVMIAASARISRGRASLAAPCSDDGAVDDVQVQVQQQVGGDAMPAWLVASSGMGGAVIQQQQQQQGVAAAAVPAAVSPQAPVGMVASGAVWPRVSVGQGPLVDVAPGVQMGSTRYQVTSPQVRKRRVKWRDLMLARPVLQHLAKKPTPHLTSRADLGRKRTFERLAGLTRSHAIAQILDSQPRTSCCEGAHRLIRCH